jgi:hypothetical protein
MKPIIAEAAKTLNISGDIHGIKHGWFNWPWNFDPVWLLSCNGFEDAKALEENARQGEKEKP